MTTGPITQETDGRAGMLKGQTFRNHAVGLHNVFLKDGAKYVIGPVPEEHYRHAALRPGVALVVAADLAPNGDTRVTLPCRCDLLLLLS